MMFFLIILSSQLIWAAPRKEVEEAKQSIRSLIAPLVQGNSKTKPRELKGFNIDGCEKHKVNWMNVLLMKETATLNYKFAKGCDIQGSITPKVFQTFAGNLDLRNLENYTRLESQNKINASIESRPVMTLNMTEGTLSGKKGKVKFEADYSVQMNPMGGKKPVEKNLGGEMRISEIYGEKVNIREKILVQ